jgi:hypothetical protein
MNAKQGFFSVLGLCVAIGVMSLLALIWFDLDGRDIAIKMFWSACVMFGATLAMAWGYGVVYPSPKVEADKKPE